MKRFHHPFFALLLSLLLIGSQQAAFAHLLSHARSGNGYLAQVQSDHGSLDGAAESCTTCIAFAGVGGNLPPSLQSMFAESCTGGSYLLPRDIPVFVRPVNSCRARAPPSTL